MLAAWCRGPMLAFDTETTGVDPQLARIVTASCITVSAEGVLKRRDWLVNPGIEIPAEATAIHGVTTDRARTDGLPADVAVAEIRDSLDAAWASGYPVVVMNARYDLDVTAAELARYRQPALEVGPVLDPLVIDRAVDKWRKGSRKLLDLAKFYGVQLGDAHNAGGDALMAARVVWRMAARCTRLQRRTLDEMQVLQARAHAEWADGFQKYLREKKGQPDAVISGAWPCSTGLSKFELEPEPEELATAEDRR